MSDSMMMVDLIEIKQRKRVMIFFRSAGFFGAKVLHMCANMYFKS